jgi:acetyltransferase-like isoleucine patch superfamily enzyme
MTRIRRTLIRRTRPPFQYSSIPVFQYSTIPVFQYSTIPVFQYSTTPRPMTNDEIQVELPARGSVFLAVKRVVQGCLLLLALPRLCCWWIGRLVLGRRAFGAASESIARVPGLRGVLLRQAFYRRTLEACGQDVYFGWMSVFSMTEARVGDRAYIGRFCSIGFADIGDEVMLADGVQILSGGREHGRSETDGATMHDQAQTYQRVRIGRGAWIGAGAIVMADVGDGAVVGAGAVVTRSVPPATTAVGVPARVKEGK